MARVQRAFKIEHMAAGGEAPLTEEARHEELLSEIRALKTHMQPQADSSQQVLESYKHEMQEALKLKAELDSIYEAIAQTKREIATLHHSGFQGEEMGRVSDELDAVVQGTESATEAILTAAESIDEHAESLSKMLTGEEEIHANHISEKVIEIFESCNFQDLTGQRITKVVNTLKFIEGRVVNMMDIWGGMEAMADVEVESMPQREGDDALLNGPALDTDMDVASQDDIDALFD
ncbi:protein phosphatase CheZ [Coralliovum pocilloporae]|uniref:protein phosphatase CheZ n=1 Tax=Coralliovum pocilloporae TaxID=3066369 RepID=UPI003307B39F